jgi:hypothetical protein
LNYHKIGVLTLSQVWALFDLRGGDFGGADVEKSEVRAIENSDALSRERANNQSLRERCLVPKDDDTREVNKNVKLGRMRKICLLLAILPHERAERRRLLQEMSEI